MSEELKIIIKAITDEAQKNLEEIKKELNNIEKESKEAGKSLGDSLKSVGAKAAIAVGAVAALTTALVSLGKSSMEFQKNQAQLNAAFQSMGGSAQQATQTYKDLFRYLGDSDTATEAAQQLANITTNKDELKEYSTILQGVYAKWGASIEQAGLAEGINHSIMMGSVQGTLADAFEFAGVSVDAFNAKLGECNSLAEREALIRSTLNSMYGTSASLYEQNNAATIAYNESQANLDIALANAAKYVTPLMTSLNSLAATLLTDLKPAFEIICAVLIVFCQWISAAIKAVASFFGSFGGEGSKATETVANNVNSVKTGVEGLTGSVGGVGDAFGDAAKQAEKLRKQTMGFDELNVVGSGSSSAGAGTGALSGAGAGANVGAIELPEFDTSTMGLDDFQKKIEDIKKKIKSLKPIIAIAGAALAAWKITQFVKDLKAGNISIKDIGKNIKTFSGTFLIIAGAISLVQGFSDAWINGLDWQNFALILGGIAAIVGGLALAVSPLAAAIGLIAGGIALVVIGIKDFVTNGYSMEAVIAIAVGAIGILIGVIWAFNAALLANPITWVVAAIMALIAVFVILWNDCDAFREFWINLWEIIKGAFNAVVDWFKEVIPLIGQWFVDAWNAIKDAFSAVGEFFAGVWDAICEAFNAVVEWFGNLFSDAWEGIKSAFSAVGTFFSEVWGTICGAFSAVSEWFKGIFEEAWEAIKGVFDGVGSFFSGIWETIKEQFSEIANKVGEAVADGFKTAVNWVLEKAIGIINGFIGAINVAIDLINAIPGVELGYIEELEVPQFAKGGIVNSATLGVFGEAGKEAVIPLENNTEWMDILADRINEKNNTPSKIVLTLDGKELGWANIHSINAITQQTGTLPLVLI